MISQRVRCVLMEMIVWRVDVDRLIRWVMPLPTGAFIIAVVLSLIFHFEQSTATHCKEAVNYLPSISAAIGEFSPQRYIWRLCIALHCTPRYLLGVCFHHLYAAGSRDVTAVNRRIYVSLVYVMTAAYFTEISCLLLLSFISSTEDYKSHEKGFITFIISATVYMITTIILCQWRRSIHNNNNSTDIDAKSLRIKTLLLAVNVICVVIGSACFIHHNKYCLSGVYTGFAVCEYAVVMSNIWFHFTCATFDLRHFSVNVVCRSVQHDK